LIKKITTYRQNVHFFLPSDSTLKKGTTSAVLFFPVGPDAIGVGDDGGVI
jgi:hypothetical protein